MLNARIKRINGELTRENEKWVDRPLDENAATTISTEDTEHLNSSYGMNHSPGNGHEELQK